MPKLVSYPPPDRSLDGSEVVAGWQDGRLRAIRVDMIARLVNAQFATTIFVDDLIAAAGLDPATQDVSDVMDQVAALIDAADIGPAVVFGSSWYNFSRPFAYTWKAGMALLTVGVVEIHQLTANTQCFCPTVRQEYQGSGRYGDFTFSWAHDAAVAQGTTAPHYYPTGDVNAIAIAWRCRPADPAQAAIIQGDGIADISYGKISFRNGFRGISQDFQDIVNGVEISLWGMSIEKLNNYYLMQGAALYAVCHVAGSPSNVLNSLYDQPDNPVEASIIGQNWSQYHIGIAEFNRTLNGEARISMVSSPGGVIDCLRFENMCLTAPGQYFVAAISTDGGTLRINSLEIRALVVAGTGLAAGQGYDDKAFILNAFAGAHISVGSVFASFAAVTNPVSGGPTPVPDALRLFLPRADTITGLPNGEITVDGPIVFFNNSANPVNGATHLPDNTDHITFRGERSLEYFIPAGFAFTDSNTYTQLTASGGVAHHLMGPRGFVRDITIELSAVMLSTGYITFQLYKNGTAISYMQIKMGTGGLTGTTGKASIALGQVDYGYGGDNTQHQFVPGDKLSWGCSVDYVGNVPSGLTARVTMRTAEY